ncbi:Uncharacterised protein [Chlamydia trachomatis]|nr:Uncharacterised protein [Chlamydia trachomatis]
MLGGTSSGIRIVTFFFIQILYIFTTMKAAIKADSRPFVPKKSLEKPP